MNFQGIDTAAKITEIAAHKLIDKGYSFVVRYLVPATGNTKWKALTADELKIIHRSGLSLMLIWELTGERMKGGLDVGKVDGATARKLAEDFEIPAGTIIYYAADYNAPEADYGAIYDYLYGASLSSGQYPVGLYGHEKLVRAMNEKKICKHFWQCVAWSAQWAEAAKVIQYEWQGGSAAKALAADLGFAVDLNRAESLNGMYQPDKPSTEADDAHQWALSMGIVDPTMRDVSQYEIMLYRFHNIYCAEDNKTSSGLLD